MSEMNETRSAETATYKSYASRKLAAIEAAAAVDGAEITMPARQFHILLQILTQLETHLQQFAQAPENALVAHQGWARQVLEEADRLAKTL